MRRALKPALLAVLILVAGIFVKGNIPQPSIGNWLSAGSMLSPRSSAASTLLQDGRIFITGGDSGAGPSTDAEFFDTTGTYIPAPPMSIPRSGHSATVLADGRVLVAGGSVGAAATNAAEIFDPAANAWTPVAGGMIQARANHSASLLADGRVLFAGGDNAGIATAALEIFDPVANSFSFVGMMSSPRMSFASAVLSDGRVLLIGGSNGTTPVAATEIFDPVTNSVAAGPALSAPRMAHSATTLLDGRVLVVGGTNVITNADGSTTPADLASAEIYDPLTGSFSVSASSLAAPRRDHVAFLLPNNNSVLIVGGTSSSNEIATAEIFVLSTGTFIATGSPATARQHAAGSALKQDGILFLAGGSNSTGTLSSAELYGFATVKTDQADYSPGSIVTITGSGWTPGETVTLSFLESPLIDTHPALTAIADSTGHIHNNQFSPDSHDLFIRFYLTAAGQTSGLQAQTTFTDALSITGVSPNSGPTLGGTSVTITGTQFVNGQGPFTLKFGGVNATNVAIVDSTHLSATTPAHLAGAVDVVVSDKTLTSATLLNGFTYGKLNQTITFAGAPATAVYNTTFSVTASASSGLTVTLGASGSCSISGSTVTMTSGTGICSLTADQPGDSNYNAAPQATQSTTAQKANQTITVSTPAPANAVYNTSFTVAATASSSLAVSYSSSGVCSNVLATFTMTSGTGICTVKFDQAGDANYNPATEITESVTAQKANQTITVSTPAPPTAVYNTNFTVAATASSSLAVSYSSSGVCSNALATFTMTSGTGTCTVKFDQAGDSNYNPATEITESVTAQKANQTITFTGAPANAVYNTTFGVTASASSGLVVTLGASGACSISGTTVTMTSGTGICSLTADQPGDSNYDAATQATQSTTAQKANQTITVSTPAPATAVNNTSFTVAATASSSLAVSYSSSGVCSNVGATFTMTSGTGTCTVKFDQAGDSNYNAATEITESVTAQKANQTITVSTPAPASAVYNTSFTVAATASSSLAVSYSSSGVCSNVGATFTMTSGTGTCTVKFDQAGDSNYNAATEITESVTAQKANQTITVSTPAPASAVYNTSFTVAATASSSLAVSYSSSGVCSNVGATFTMTSGTGTCTVKFDQAGDSNYNAATEITESVTAQKANQTITVSTPAPASAVYNTSFTVAATASSSLAVSYSSSGVCSNAGATFTMTSGTGTCTVKFDQAGDSNYNAATEITESVTAQKANQTITVSTPAPATAVYNTSFTVAATASSSLAVSYSSSGVCSNAGATFTMTSGTGTCTVKFDQAGDSNYNAATEITESVTAQKANQTISFTGAPANAVYNTAFGVTASASSGLTVTLGASGSCSISGSTVTMTSGTGICSLTADQPGDNNYNAGTQATQSTTAQKANQTISFTGAPATA